MEKISCLCWIHRYDGDMRVNLSPFTQQDLKNQSQVKLSIVHCPPVTMAIIKRPDPKYQLGFSVEDGIVRCIIAV